LARLAIFLSTVPIPRRTLKMKRKKINNGRRRKNPATRKISTKGKIIFTQKNKTTVH
jgi:hypothetical protein